MLTSRPSACSSRLGRVARRSFVAAALPAVVAGTLALAPAAHAEVNTDTAPYGWANVGDCHIMVGGYANPDRYGFGDATVSCTDPHYVDVSVYLLKDDTVIRTGYRSAGVPIYATGDVLTSPPVCGDGNATWQTMAVVTIDGGTDVHVQSPVGGAYLQGACP